MKEKKKGSPADPADASSKVKKKKAPAPVTPQRRMTSITRGLHWYLIRRKLAIWLPVDILILAGGAMAWCADQEFTRTGAFLWKNHRSFSAAGGWKSLTFRLSDPEGKLLFSAPCYPALKVLLIFVAVLAAIQLLSLLFSYGGEDKKIRRILAPINEIALKMDEMSRMSFSEDKYQVIEEAISHIRPGENENLSFGDQDLTGIEAAVNNLLLRMRETNRQQARFVNDASHELRTPIAVIQGYANMLDRWGKTDERILDESITAIKGESNHMNHLVEQLLFLARGDSGRTVLKPEELCINTMMEELYEESLMIDEAHSYRITRQDQRIMVHADPTLLKQAVRILIDNAAKYTENGNEILLSYGMDEAESHQYWLQVQDTGIGMSESDVRQMFERFFRSDEVRSYSGTGLGLSIAKWIVDRHKGHFEILSRTGLGTRIRILLPV